MSQATPQPGPQKHGFRYHFSRSTYITLLTDWFLSFFGKAAHLVLILTTLYTGAALLPGVSLPGPLNNAVFVVQMLVLDVGGMGLAKLAMQAKDQGNEEGAKKAENLSKWLIRIVIASLVTAAIEQTMKTIPGQSNISEIISGLNIAVGGVLTVARAVCAVNYGRVIHSLKIEDDNEQYSIPVIEIEEHIRKAIDDLGTKLLADQQKALNEFKQGIETNAPNIDYGAIANVIAPQLRATMQDQLRTIAEEIQSQQASCIPEPEPSRQLKASSQSHIGQPVLTLLPALKPEPETTARANGHPEQRLQAAYDLLITKQIRISGRALAKEAHVNRETASKWLAEIKGQQEEPESGMVVEASYEIESSIQSQ